MKKIFGDFDVMVKQCFLFFVFALVALFIFGCSTQSKNIVYYQAYDANWDDPTLSLIHI